MTREQNNHINNLNSVTFVTDEIAGEGTIAFVGLGANLGDRHANIQTALSKLADSPEVEIIHSSSLYETTPVGVTDQPDFLNTVAAVRTMLPPRGLLAALLHIENQMGRARNLRWGPRVIDLDLLLYGDQQIQSPGLTVPHPRLRERAFVLVPLAEIAPDLRLPGDDKKVGEWVKNLPKNLSGEGNIRRVGFV